MRPPIAAEHVTFTEAGLVAIQLKKPFRDGTVSVEMDPLSLVSRLAASVHHRPRPSPPQARKTLATRCPWPSPPSHDRPPIAAATSPGGSSCASSVSMSKPARAVGAR
jgi:hypothetical protein